jgi:ankyrin repeat protein
MKGLKVMRLTIFSLIALLFLAASAWAGPAQDKAFIEAVEKGDLTAAQTALQQGAHVNARSDYQDQTALIVAARLGNEKLVQFLLSQKADVNARDNFKATALMYAAAEGHLPIVEALTAHKADLDLQDNFGKTALMDAIAVQQEAVIKFLLAKKINVNLMNRLNKTAWVYAIERGDGETAKALLGKGAKEKYDALEWSGEYSPFNGPYETVIRTDAEWRRLWTGLFQNDRVPLIDFDRYVIAAVFLGTKPTGGYGAEFDEPRKEGKNWIISYRELEPKGFVTQAFTQPYLMKVFKRKGSSMALRKQTV